MRLRQIFKRLRNSIAIYPAVIAVLFLLCFWGMITLDDTAAGKYVKATWTWLRMKDAATARLIASTIAGGILSFTVFTFSMVMIVLNQTASKMSNRILEIIIRNRFQQIVLGCYIGTVLYSLLLITAVRDVDKGVYVPALSTYLLIGFAMLDVFLFIYFLHFVTRYAKYQTIINHIHAGTLKQIKAMKGDNVSPPNTNAEVQLTLGAPQAGYFSGCSEDTLLSLPCAENLCIRFLYPTGTYLLKGVPFAEVQSNVLLPDGIGATIIENTDWETEVSDDAYETGFAHLNEVAVKALSPGINDPATAILCLHVLADLFAIVMQQPMKSAACRKNVTLLYRTLTVDELLVKYLLPIWDYGKEDRSIQAAMEEIILQLLQVGKTGPAYKRLQDLLQQVKQEQAQLEEKTQAIKR